MAAPFRLARVLRLRERLRRLRQHEAYELAAGLAAALAEVSAVAARRERLGVEEAQAAAAGTLSPEGLRLGRAYDRALATAEAAWNARADATRAALAAKREELVRARWEERKLGRLEQQHRVRVAEEEAQADARTLDELAMARHARAERK